MSSILSCVRKPKLVRWVVFSFFSLCLPCARLTADVVLGHNDFSGWTSASTPEVSLYNIDSIDVSQGQFRKSILGTLFPYKRMETEIHLADPNETTVASVSFFNHHSVLDPSQLEGEVDSISWNFQYQMAEQNLEFGGIGLVAYQGGKHFALDLPSLSPANPFGILDEIRTLEDENTISNINLEIEVDQLREFSFEPFSESVFGSEKLDFSTQGEPISFGFNLTFGTNRDSRISLNALDHSVRVKGVAAVPEPSSFVLLFGFFLPIAMKRQR